MVLKPIKLIEISVLLMNLEIACNTFRESGLAKSGSENSLIVLNAPLDPPNPMLVRLEEGCLALGLTGFQREAPNAEQAIPRFLRAAKLLVEGSIPES